MKGIKRYLNYKIEGYFYFLMNFVLCFYRPDKAIKSLALFAVHKRGGGLVI
jgi:hypothetical protein